MPGSAFGPGWEWLRVHKAEELVHAQLQTPKQARVPAAWNI